MESAQGGCAPAQQENWNIWSGLAGIREDLFLKPVLLLKISCVSLHRGALDDPFLQLYAWKYDNRLINMLYCYTDPSLLGYHGDRSF